MTILPRIIKLLLLFTCFFVIKAGATHIIGGELTYKYIGKFNNLYRYELHINMYRDCQYGRALLDNSIELGIYENVSGTKYLSDTLTIPIYDSTNVNLPNEGHCTSLPPSCLQVGHYIGSIDLPGSVYGYHITYQRCCRKNSNVNIPSDQGATYYGFIPPTNYNNNSPSFSSVPSPYFCVGDTVVFGNFIANDVDGDSLAYALAKPYNGGDSILPIPTPSSIFTLPIPRISYYPGYSYTRPFGSSGFASIDPVTGLTTLHSTKTGTFVIAVDVAEYRNGVLLSKVRRDIQIIVNNCPPSVTPKREGDTGSFGSNKASYSVEAGNRLIIDLLYTAKDTSVLLGITHSGELFDKALRIHVATMNDSSRKGAVVSRFSWQTDCKDVRSRPYILVTNVSTNGCPPKFVAGTIPITVIPFKGADTIFGPRNVCSGQKALYYIRNGKKRNSYFWDVKGYKNITTSIYSDSIVVEWGPGPVGSIKLTQKNSAQCFGDTPSLNIKIYPIPVTPGINGPTFVCAHDTAKYSLKTRTIGSAYHWKAKGGNIIKSDSQSITVKWGTQDTAEVDVIEENKIGCLGDTVRLKVTKNVPLADSLAGSYSVCPNSRGIDYYIYRHVTAGSTYKWKVSGGVQASGGNTSHITVNWGNKGKGKVQVIETTQYGCVGDTLSMDVAKEYAIVTSPIFGDTSLCEFASNKPYSVIYTHNSTYNWTISGGSFTTPDGISAQLVNWGAAGAALLIVNQTAYDSVNNQPCIAKAESLAVNLYPLPTTKLIQADSIICQGDVKTYIVSGLPGSTFIWSYSDGNSLINGQGNDTITIPHNKQGYFTISVYEITHDSCIGNPLRVNLTVNPSPKTSLIKGPDKVCAPDLSDITYSVSGDLNSLYTWNAIGGSIVSGGGTSTVKVTWLRPGFDTLYVVESNTYGCSGQKMSLPVLMDSAVIEMQLVSTLRSNESQVELYWKTLNSQFLKGPFYVMRRPAGQRFEELVDTVSRSAGYYLDKTPATSKYSYYYRIKAANNCDNGLYSDVHRSILLGGQVKNDSVIVLKWNAYEGWKNGVRHYSIFRSTDTDTTLYLYGYTNDTFVGFIAGLDASRQCFRVAALKDADSSIISWSNSTCFEFEPIVYVPDIFTPDGNSLNDKFHVFVSYWKAYDLHIFNRWGEDIFNSSDPAIQWDGTFRGTRCPVGSYLYLINVQGLHTTVHKTGTVTILK